MTDRSAQRSDAIDPARLAQANINPATGLATDYLNHFNEAIMLLELLSDCFDCATDFLAWQPMYREHFAAPNFKDRALAIRAYESADPAVRHCLDTLADTMAAVLEATRNAMRSDLPQPVATALAESSAASLKPLVARAGAVINGETSEVGRHPDAPQLAIDQLMKR